MIVTPSKLIPNLINECGEVGIRSVVVISAGFKEAGPEGKELERQLLENAKQVGHPHHRAELPGRDDSALGRERHVRRRHGAARATSAS